MGCHHSIPRKPGIEFDKIKDKIMPLDLILFKGTSFFSDIIMGIEKEELGNGEWSHCGIVVTTDILPIKNGIPGEKYIWETLVPMSPNDVKNFETGKFYGGLQIRKLIDVINIENNNNKSCVGWCSLKNNPLTLQQNDTDISYMMRQNVSKAVLVTIYNAFNLKSEYEFDFFRSVGAIIPSLDVVANKPITSRHKFFCSEFVAYVYGQLKIITNVEPSKIAPVSFISDTNIYLLGIVDKPIIITKNWSKIVNLVVV